MPIKQFMKLYRRTQISFLTKCVLNSYDKYNVLNLKVLSRFAIGLEKDLNAVQNSVASPLSNGFVEGTNSILKMIKRTMYGR